MIKNKLNSKWSLWFDDFKSENEKQDYEKNLYLVYSFDSIENFWKTINNVPVLNELPNNTAYHMMRFGIKPLWEDKKNYQGSLTRIKWKGEMNNDFFKESMIFLVSLEHSNEYKEEEINGISILKKDKDSYIFEIWSNKKEEPEKFIESFTKNVGKHIQFSFEKGTMKRSTKKLKKFKNNFK